MSNSKNPKSPSPRWFSYLILQFLFILHSYSLGSQEKVQIGPESFDREFTMAESIAEFPPGSYYLDKDDFVIAAGRKYEGSPPPSRSSFLYREEKIQNLGEFNNRAIKMLIERGSLDESEYMLELAIDYDPVFFPVRYNYARVLELNGKYKESKFQFEKASRLIPDYYRTFLHLGILDHKLNRFPEAGDYFSKASKLHVLRDEAKALLCIYSFRKGYSSSYRKFKDSSYPNPPKPNEALCQASEFYYKGEFGKVVQILKRVKLPDTEEPWAYLKLYHYFLADSADQIGDISTSFQNWDRLKNFRFDFILLEIPYPTILRKREIAERILEEKKKK